MSPSQRFLLELICVCLGLVLADSWPRIIIANWPWLALAAVWVSVALSLILLAQLWPSPLLRQASASLICLLAGLACGLVSRSQFEPGPLPYTQLVNLTGRVSAFPKFKGRHQDFVVTTTETGRPVKILVTTLREPPVQRGALITLTGELIEPVNQPEFPEADYLAGQNILAKIRYPKSWHILRPPSGFWRAINLTRDHIQTVLTENLPEPVASLALGLSIGINPDLDPVLADNLRRTNLTHLAAVSGQNLTLAIFFLFSWLRRFWLKGAVALALVLLVFYSLIVGGQASVVRASIMSGLVLLSLLVGRPNDSLRLLLIAATLIALANPIGLTHDIGFGLSVFALAGLILFEPILEARLTFLPRAARILVATTTAATLAVAPIQIAAFGTVSLVGIPANVAVGLLVPLAMGGALIMSVLGSLLPIMARPLGLMLYAPLQIIYLLTNWIGGQPWAQVAWQLPAVYRPSLVIAGLAFLVVLTWARLRRPVASLADLGVVE